MVAEHRLYRGAKCSSVNTLNTHTHTKPLSQRILLYVMQVMSDCQKWNYTNTLYVHETRINPKGFLNETNPRERIQQSKTRMRFRKINDDIFTGRGRGSCIYTVNMILRLLFILFAPFRKRVDPKGVPDVVRERGRYRKARKFNYARYKDRGRYTAYPRIIYGDSMMRALCYIVYNIYRRIFDTRFNTWNV
jgi:hypothetical protein